MVGKRLIFLCALLLIAVQMNRVNSEPVFSPELLKYLNMPAITSQLKNLLGQGSNYQGLGDVTGMAQSMSVSSSSNGNEKQESVGASFLKLLSP